MSLFWLRAALILYGIGLVDGLASLLSRRTQLLRVTVPAVALAAVFHFVALVELFSFEHRFVPNASHEVESLLAFCLMLFFLFVYWFYKTSSQAIVVFPLVFVLTLFATIGQQHVQISAPLLRSGWIFFHIALILAGYSALTFSLITSILYLVQERSLKRKIIGGLSWLPSLDTLDRISSRMLIIGFPFMTVGLILGAVFAEVEYGSTFLRDPKIMLSLLLWFVYIVLLYTRWSNGWRGRRAAYLSTFAFALAITAWAANYVSSVHRFMTP